MALPFVPIVAAATPLVLGALELLRGRSVAREERMARQEERDHTRALAALEARLRALEDADLEQVRLVSELSASLEGAARASQTVARATDATLGRHERLVWVALVAGFSALSLSTWNLVH